MNDDEILDRLKRADALLAEYEQLVRPVAAELARRKSIAVFGAEGGYKGYLGCWEYGLDWICLHLEDAWRDRENGPDSGDDGVWQRVAGFEEPWKERARAAGVTRIGIGGHY